MSWTNHDLFALFVALVPAMVLAGVLKNKVNRLEADDLRDRKANDDRASAMQAAFTTKVDAMTSEFRHAVDSIREELKVAVRLDTLHAELKYDVRRIDDAVERIGLVVAKLEERTGLGGSRMPVSEPRSPRTPVSTPPATTIRKPDR